MNVPDWAFAVPGEAIQCRYCLMAQEVKLDHENGLLRLHEWHDARCRRADSNGHDPILMAVGYDVLPAWLSFAT